MKKILKCGFERNPCSLSALMSFSTLLEPATVQVFCSHTAVKTANVFDTDEATYVVL